MKSHSKFLLVTICLVLFNCKQEDTKPKLDYKYANEENIIICDDFDVLLYNEALYAFEKDLLNYFAARGQSIYSAYNSYMKNFMGDRIQYHAIVSPHTLEVFEALKLEKDLWITHDSISKLNYEADIFKCVSVHFKNRDLETTFNALVSTNSMTPKLFASALLPQISTASRNRYLTTYIALDFYSNLFGIEMETVKARVEEQEKAKKTADSLNNLNTPIIKPELKNDEVSDPHAGHNH